MKIAIVSAWSPIERTEADDDLPLRLIRELRNRADSVSILTTCASELDEPWKPNRHDPGEFEVEGMTVQRFRTDPRDVRRFSELNRVAHPLDREQSELIATSINSTALLSHIARHSDDYDVLIFLASFSGVVLRGCRIAQAQTVIAGTISDIRYADFSATRAMMLGANGILLESDHAQEQAHVLYGPGIVANSAVFGTPDALAKTVDRIGGAPRASRGEDVVPSVEKTSEHIVHRLARAEYAESQTLLALSLNALLKRNGYRSRVVADIHDRKLGTQVEDPSTDFDAATIRVAYVTAPAERRDERASITVMVGGTVPMFVGTDGTREPIPLYVDVESWKIEPAREVMQPLSDGRNNLLCLGDVVPNNRLIELIEIFRHYRLLDTQGRLVIVGRSLDEKYAARIRSYLDRCGLADHVQLLGIISQPALAAVYRTARVFVSLRDRYETGLSLLEAMEFNVPVCLRDVPTARALTENKALLFSGLRHPIQVAALWRALTDDGALRDRVIASQRLHLRSRTAERTLRVLESLIGTALEVTRV